MGHKKNKVSMRQKAAEKKRFIIMGCVAALILAMIFYLIG
jgi:putative flippase GtrA